MLNRKVHYRQHSSPSLVQTPTCFATGVPSSGSALEQRSTSPTR